MTTDQPDTTIDGEVDFWCIMHGIADAGLKSDLKNFISTKIAQEANKARLDTISDMIIECYNHDSPMEIAEELIKERCRLEAQLTAEKGMS